MKKRKKFHIRELEVLFGGLKNSPHDKGPQDFDKQFIFNTLVLGSIFLKRCSGFGSGKIELVFSSITFLLRIKILSFLRQNNTITCRE
jgi:hypothetical protein